MTNSPTISSTGSVGAADSRQPVAGGIHTLGLLILLGGWAYLGRAQAIHMRAEAVPNHLQVYLPIFVFEWLLFAYVYLGIRSRGVTLRELIGPRWTSATKFLHDAGIAIVFLIASALVLSLVGLLLRNRSGMEAVRYMAPQGAFETVQWVLLSITAGICEETIFRGYLQRQFIGWTQVPAVGIVISGAIFGACHIYQGYKQAIAIAVFGVLFGTLAAIRRSLKPGIIAHALQDSAAGIVISYLMKHNLGGM